MPVIDYYKMLIKNKKIKFYLIETSLQQKFDLFDDRFCKGWFAIMME